MGDDHGRTTTRPGMTDPQNCDIGLAAQRVEDPRIAMLDERIAELVAEALFNRLVKNVLANRSKQRIISPEDTGDVQTTHSA